MVEEENDEVVNVTTSILPYSCESFYVEGTTIPGLARTQITWWEPEIIVFSLIPLRYEEHSYRLSVEMFYTPTPGEPECEVKNILAEAFNTAAQWSVRNFAQLRYYLLPDDWERLEDLMDAKLTSELAPHFPLSTPLVNIPATVELDGYPARPAIPGTEYNCCE